MAKRKRSQPEMFTVVTDELFDDLTALGSQRIVHVEIWEDSLAEALGGEDSLFDLDLYLEEGIFFELYGASGFPDLDANPLSDMEALRRELLSMINRHIKLVEIAVDEEDNLVLVLGTKRSPQLYLVAGGWLLNEWEELPGS